MKLQVYGSLAEDINNGWVWVPETIINQRNVIKLTNVDTGKSIYCEALQIGDNFLARYNDGKRTFPIQNNDNSIVINEWYRKKLKITATQEQHNFNISIANNPWGT